MADFFEPQLEAMVGFSRINFAAQSLSSTKIISSEEITYENADYRASVY
jgi:hypothetical protein